MYHGKNKKMNKTKKKQKEKEVGKFITENFTLNGYSANIYKQEKN